MPPIYYVCPVLPPDATSIWQRPKVWDIVLPKGSSIHLDIPVDESSGPNRGRALKSWCIVAVDTTPAAHARIRRDREIVPILRRTVGERRRVRAFLRNHGEEIDSEPGSSDDAEDEPERILRRLHRMSDHGHIPRLADLGKR